MSTARLVVSAALVLASAGLLVAHQGASSPPPAVTPDGHLVLVVEGNANALTVTRMVRKADPCGPVERIASDYRIVVQDAAGATLGNYPLDLSAFDLQAEHVGTADRAVGCQLISSRVATLASIPHWPQARALRLTGPGGALLGQIEATAYRTLLEGGR